MRTWPTWRRSGGVLLCLLVLAPVLTVLAAPSVRAQGEPEAPNIVLILVDDMRATDYQALPKTKELLGSRGVTFENFFVTTPVCCPSRSSILLGQYVHNHNVRRNSGPTGGWETFHEQKHERRTIALALQDEGYRTALVGKYMNGYGRDERKVPIGWDRWYATTDTDYYNYELNENGKLVAYGDKNRHYATDVLAGKAKTFITSTPSVDPLFLYFTPKAPHGPSTVANRHQAQAKRFRLEKDPESFNEPDISDKPSYMQGPKLTARQVKELEALEKKRLGSLLAVDDAVEGIVETLQAEGRLDNTYIVFASDNGFLMGQHRRSGKAVPYEEAIRIPMIVAGPTIANGATSDAIVANIDLAPTFADLAGIEPGAGVDGRSVVPSLDGGGSTRDAILIEGFGGGDDEGRAGVDADAAPIEAKAAPSYAAIRTMNRLYVEYTSGEKELYDLDTDRDQVDNYADEASDAELQELSGQLQALKSCQGESCRTADSGAGNRNR